MQSPVLCVPDAFGAVAPTLLLLARAPSTCTPPLTPATSLCHDKNHNPCHTQVGQHEVNGERSNEPLMSVKLWRPESLTSVIEVRQLPYAPCACKPWALGGSRHACLAAPAHGRVLLMAARCSRVACVDVVRGWH